MEGALSGVRILDFTRAVAGAFGSLILGDMGAEINKIETIPDADPPVTYPQDVQPTESIAHFWGLNRGKKSICLDLTKRSSREVVHDLVKKSDVVYDNFRPGVLQKLGIDYETISKINPRIVSCSISGYGETGPLKDQPSYDVVAQALSGMMSITDDPERLPCQGAPATGDIGAGVVSAFGMVCALLSREKTGKGQRVETSILDTLLAYQSYRVPQTFGVGMKIHPHLRRSGAGQVPWGGFRAKDGNWIAIAAGTPKFWENFCKAIGNPELINDPRFNSVEKRVKREDEVSRIAEEAIATKTTDEWVQILTKAGVPVGKVNNIEEAFLQPQAQVRNMLISIDHPLGKKMKFAGNPLKMSGTRTQEYKPAPGWGEHTREVLSGLLGYPDDKIAKLREERAVWYPVKGVSWGSGGAMARF